MGQQKTEHVKRMIVRHIRERQLKIGDRLPPQDFFRKEYFCGTSTVRAALDELKNDGVLEIRDKVGVFVIDPNADGHAGNVIGICAVYSDSPYYCCLLCIIQEHLNRLGCMARLFFKENPNPEKDDIDFDISDYPGLARSVENKLLDGLIHLDEFNARSLRFFEKTGLPALLACGLPLSENSVSYDQSDILRRMCATLKKMNVKRPALVSVKATEQYIDPLFLECTGLKGTLLSNGASPHGELVVKKFMDLPEKERPDIILYLDDILCQSITAQLALRLLPDRVPMAMILRNKQLRISFAVQNPIFFTMDLDQFAGLTVETLMKNVKTGNPRIGQVFYRPEEEITLKASSSKKEYFH